MRQAEQDSEYDDSEVEELKLKLIKYVIEKLNPMIAQLNLLKEDKKKLKEFVPARVKGVMGKFLTFLIGLFNFQFHNNSTYQLDKNQL